MLLLRGLSMSEQDQKYSYIIGSAQNIEAYLKAQDETATEQKIELKAVPSKLVKHKRQLNPFLEKYNLANNREGILLFLNKKSFELNQTMLDKLRMRLIADARSRGQDLSDLPGVISQVSEDNGNYEALQLYLNKLLELKKLQATPKKDLGKLAVNFDDLEDHGKSLSLK